MQIIFGPVFKKQFRKAPARIVAEFRKTIFKLENDEFDPSLKNHKLHGEYSDCRSVNVNADWRLIYKKLSTDVIVLTALGTHSQLYE
jgi:addiction module RelE/StbE family toxin